MSLQGILSHVLHVWQILAPAGFMFGASKLWSCATLMAGEQRLEGQSQPSQPVPAVILLQ
jgi:hypothetical protein